MKKYSANTTKEFNRLNELSSNLDYLDLDFSEFAGNFNIYEESNNLSKYLDLVDNDLSYIRQWENSLTSYERQLARYDLKVSSEPSIKVSKFIHPDSKELIDIYQGSLLLKEYIRKEFISFLRENDLLNELVAISSFSPEKSYSIVGGYEHINLESSSVEFKDYHYSITNNDKFEFIDINSLDLFIKNIANKFINTRLFDLIEFLNNSLEKRDIYLSYRKFRAFDLEPSFSKYDVIICSYSFEHLKLIEECFGNKKVIRTSRLNYDEFIALDSKSAIEMVNDKELDSIKLVQDEGELSEIEFHFSTGFNIVDYSAVTKFLVS